jgi:hypothetical protein
MYELDAKLGSLLELNLNVEKDMACHYIKPADKCVCHNVHFFSLIFSLTLMSSSSSVRLEFTSDLSTSSSGFFATWSVFELIRGCPNSTVTSASGTINFPDFSGGDVVYAGPLDCYTTLIAPGKTKL